jgi:hypothetical protein
MQVSVTRSHKLNGRDHSGLSDGTAAPLEHIPRYFAKSGPIDADPKKTKKDGGGKGNWLVPLSYSFDCHFISCVYIQKHGLTVRKGPLW